MPRESEKNQSGTLIYITRREFYLEISLLWMILTMILVEFVNRENGPLKLGQVILLTAAFTLWMISLFRVYREKNVQKNIAMPLASGDMK